MAHCNTIFHHMLKLIPRHHFSKIEREHGTGRPARTFSRWHQLVHLIFMQVTSRTSLRDGVRRLKARFKQSLPPGRASSSPFYVCRCQQPSTRLVL